MLDNITAKQAKSFWKDLQRTLFPDNPDFEGKHNHGWILSTETIADRMQMDPETSRAWMPRGTDCLRMCRRAISS